MTDAARADADTDTPPDAAGLAPRRLHPASMVMDLIRNLPQTLIALPAAFAFLGRFGIGRVLALAVAAVAVNALFTWAKWRRFTYAIADDAVVIQSGLFARNRRILPLDRVQDVDIERKLLQRAFGLAKVSLETGGAGKDEAVLDSVTLAEAHRLRAVIRGHVATDAGGPAAAAAAGPAAPVAAAPVLFAMGWGRVLIYGAFSFSLVWMAVLFGALQYLDRAIGDYVPNDIRLDRQALAAQVTAAIVLSVLALFAVLGVLSGIVGTTLREAGFTLTDEGGRLRRVRGLLTRTEAVVALRRVQLALLVTGPVRAAFGWSGLSLQTLGGSGDRGGRQEVAPFAKGDEIDRVLATTAMRRVDPEAMTRVSGAHVLRAVARAAVPVGLLVGVAGVFGPGWGIAALALAPLPILRALLVRRHHRYARGGGQLSVARGVVKRRLWLIPERNVQTLTIRRSPLQRWLGTATLVPDSAGGTGAAARISDLPVATAWALARSLAEDRSVRPREA